MVKYPILSLHLCSLQNNLHAYTGCVTTTTPEVPLPIQTATPQGGFSKVPSSFTAPVEKISSLDAVEVL